MEMTDRHWAIEQAAKAGAEDIIAEAQRILAFVSPPEPVIQPRKSGKSWSAERKAMLKEMRLAGHGYLEIAESLNALPGKVLSRTTVACYGQYMGLPTVAPAHQIAAAKKARAARRINQAAA